VTTTDERLLNLGAALDPELRDRLYRLLEAGSDAQRYAELAERNAALVSRLQRSQDIADELRNTLLVRDRQLASKVELLRAVINYDNANQSDLPLSMIEQIRAEIPRATVGVIHKTSIAAKIEASSLGTPEAKALRATVSDEHAARIVARAEALRGEAGLELVDLPCPECRQGKHGNCTKITLNHRDDRVPCSCPDRGNGLHP
jgi:hypothetical protein